MHFTALSTPYVTPFISPDNSPSPSPLRTTPCSPREYAKPGPILVPSLGRALSDYLDLTEGDAEQEQEAQRKFSAEAARPWTYAGHLENSNALHSPPGRDQMQLEVLGRFSLSFVHYQFIRHSQKANFEDIYLAVPCLDAHPYDSCQGHTQELGLRFLLTACISALILFQEGVGCFESFVASYLSSRFESGQGQNHLHLQATGAAVCYLTCCLQTLQQFGLDWSMICGCTEKYHCVRALYFIHGSIHF